MGAAGTNLVRAKDATPIATVRNSSFILPVCVGVGRLFFGSAERAAGAMCVDVI